MDKISLTKNTIKKFYNTPIEVRLWNGCFNKAEINITNNRKDYRLEVYVTHPLLHWQCGDKNEVKLFVMGGFTQKTVFQKNFTRLSKRCVKLLQ